MAEFFKYAETAIEYIEAFSGDLSKYADQLQISPLGVAASIARESTRNTLEPGFRSFLDTLRVFLVENTSHESLRQNYLEAPEFIRFTGTPANIIPITVTVTEIIDISAELNYR